MIKPVNTHKLTVKEKQDNTSGGGYLFEGASLAQNRWGRYRYLKSMY